MVVAQSIGTLVGRFSPLPRNGMIEELNLSGNGADGLELFEEHLIRLPKEVRRQRFGNWTSDAFIADYVRTSARLGTRVYALIVDGEVRGVAEVRPLFDEGRRAKAAFTIEPAWQGAGHGTTLMGRALAEAHRQGFTEVFICCESRNTRLQHVAEKFGGTFSFEDSEGIATIRVEHMELESFAIVPDDLQATVVQITSTRTALSI